MAAAPGIGGGRGGEGPGRPAPLRRRHPAAPGCGHSCPLLLCGLSSPKPAARGEPAPNPETLEVGSSPFPSSSQRPPFLPQRGTPTSAASGDQRAIRAAATTVALLAPAAPAGNPDGARSEPGLPRRAVPRCGLPPVSPLPRSDGSRRGGCAALRMIGRRRKGP